MCLISDVPVSLTPHAWATNQERRARKIADLARQHGTGGPLLAEQRQRKEQEARERARAEFLAKSRDSINKTLQWADNLQRQRKTLMGKVKAKREAHGSAQQQQSDEPSEVVDTEQSVGKRSKTPETMVLARSNWMNQRLRRQALAAQRSLHSAPGEDVNLLKGVMDGREGSVSGSESDEYDEAIETAIEQVAFCLCVVPWSGPMRLA